MTNRLRNAPNTGQIATWQRHKWTGRNGAGETGQVRANDSQRQNRAKKAGRARCGFVLQTLSRPSYAQGIFRHEGEFDIPPFHPPVIGTDHAHQFHSGPSNASKPYRRLITHGDIASPIAIKMAHRLEEQSCAQAPCQFH